MGDLFADFRRFQEFPTFGDVSLSTLNYAYPRKAFSSGTPVQTLEGPDSFSKIVSTYLDSRVGEDGQTIRPKFDQSYKSPPM